MRSLPRLKATTSILSSSACILAPDIIYTGFVPLIWSHPKLLLALCNYTPTRLDPAVFSHTFRPNYLLPPTLCARNFLSCDSTTSKYLVENISPSHAEDAAAPMYSTQPNGADSATINPAALSSGKFYNTRILVASYHFFCLSMIPLPKIAFLSHLKCCLLFH